MKLNTNTSTAAINVDIGLRKYMVAVYANMAIGILITAFAALFINYLAVTSNPQEAAAVLHSTYLTKLGATIYSSPLRYVIMLAPLAFVFILSFKLDTLPISTARGLFFAYAAVTGVSLSSIFLLYTSASIVQTFFITAAAFGGLSLYGYTTQRNLGPMGSFLIMGVIGLVAASLVNMFLHSSQLEFIISIVGVLLFSGLTAYDTQTIKLLYLESDEQDTTDRKAIHGALVLYLDFINLFIMLLRFFGERRD